MIEVFTLTNLYWFSAFVLLIAVFAVINARCELKKFLRKINASSASPMMYLSGVGSEIPKKWFTPELSSRLDELRRALGPEVVLVKIKPAHDIGLVADVDVITDKNYYAISYNNCYEFDPFVRPGDSFSIKELGDFQIVAKCSGKRWLVEVNSHATKVHPKNVVEVFTAILNHDKVVKGINQVAQIKAAWGD